MLPTIEACFPIWIGLGVFVALQWLTRLVMLSVEFRRRRMLGSRSHPGQPGDLPRLTMMVAAKDEEEHIATCVSSLLMQDYPNLEVIAIDDRSDDQTPVILKRLADESNGRLRVVSILHLQDGWFGKNNAMREGVAASGGDWLCFTDADCRLTSMRALTVAMQEALKHDVDFLTITPVLEMNTLWEKVTQPACAQSLMFWFQPSRVNDPNQATAYANGAFMLMSRNCYNTIGGHDRVKTEVNEDIQLARYAKAAGLKLRMVENDDLYRTQMYGSALQSFRGWSRILFGSLKSSWRLCFSLTASLLFTVLPPMFLAISLIGRSLADASQISNWTMAVGVWLGAVVLCQAAAWRFYSFLKANRWWSLTYVLGASVTVAILLNALLKQIGVASTTWRGTTYRRDERVDVPA
jgi:chlorobactene glucosyltransferase